MPELVVIDDRAVIRKQLVRIMSPLVKRQGWDVREMPPLRHKEDYGSWLAEHSEIAVLVLDENLHEQTDDAADEAVDYDGHDVVAELRGRFPEFPIYVVTSAAVDSDDLKAAAPDVEYIFDRNAFLAEAPLFVTRMLRAGARFEQAMAEQLDKLSQLSLKAAMSTASHDELRQLDELRAKFALPFSGTTVAEQASDLLPKAEALIAEARGLVNKLKAKQQ
jgi:CheY-like chemotaxis protein